jgi:hypothetical protein
MPWHVDGMPVGELEEFLSRLSSLPPIGGITGPYEAR